MNDGERSGQRRQLRRTKTEVAGTLINGLIADGAVIFLFGSSVCYRHERWRILKQVVGSRMPAYRCTTRSSDYLDWDWYQAFRDQIEAEKAKSGLEPLIKLANQPLPIDVGIDFCRWVMKTPEIRDIIYKRFVLGHYDDVLEGNLLSYSTSYFLTSHGISGAGGLLSFCWLRLAAVLKGEFDSVDAPEFRAELLELTCAFAETIRPTNLGDTTIHIQDQ